MGINRAISKIYGAGSVLVPDIAGGVSGGEPWSGMATPEQMQRLLFDI